MVVDLKEGSAIDIISYALSKQYTDKQLQKLGLDGTALTPESIINTLGYTPADDVKVAMLAQEIAKFPESYTLPVASADTLGGVKIGEGLQMDGDVLGVKPEDEWELIETLTLEESLTAFERTQEPDGTPYNFEAMLFKFKTQGTAQTDCAIRACDSNRRMLMYSYFTITANSYGANEIYKRHGYWEAVRHASNTSQSEYGQQRKTGNSWLATVKADTNINSIKLANTLVQGMTIEIFWGGCEHETENQHQRRDP